MSRFASDLYRALPYSMGFGMPVSVVLGYAAGGGWTFLTVLGFVFVVPLAEWAVGRERQALDNRDPGPLYARYVTWAWVPVQLSLLAWAITVVGGGATTSLEWVGLVTSVGLTTGSIGITCAHELLHRANRLERGLGQLLMLSVSYPHFRISHVEVHHVLVGTPRDPATARVGESCYAFVGKAFWCNLASARAVERRRLARRPRSVAWMTDRIVRSGCLLAAVYLGVELVSGLAGVLLLLGQSIVAVGLLEVINYVEHYGLTRHRTASGRLEAIQAHHSWESNHIVTNWILLNLARHADHHLSSGKPFIALRPHQRAPLLPAGYATMCLVALVPWVWRRVMDPRIDGWSRAHVFARPMATSGVTDDSATRAR